MPNEKADHQDTVPEPNARTIVKRLSLTAHKVGLSRPVIISPSPANEWDEGCDGGFKIEFLDEQPAHVHPCRNPRDCGGVPS